MENPPSRCASAARFADEASAVDVIATLPEGHRTKADIDQQLADERTAWPDGS
jgi:hypothetical protein